MSDRSSTPVRGWLRLARMAALGATTLTLTLIAHLLAGGSAPSPGLAAFLALAMGPLLAALTSRRLRLGPLLGILGLGQVALHLVLSAATAPVTNCQPVAAHTVHSLMSWTGCDPGPARMAMAVSACNGAMWIAHLAATALTAWLLARGEAWLWRTLDAAAAAAGARPSSGPRERLISVTPVVIHTWTRRWIRPEAPRGPPVAYA